MSSNTETHPLYRLLNLVVRVTLSLAAMIAPGSRAAFPPSVR